MCTKRNRKTIYHDVTWCSNNFCSQHRQNGKKGGVVGCHRPYTLYVVITSKLLVWHRGKYTSNCKLFITARVVLQTNIKTQIIKEEH